MKFGADRGQSASAAQPDVQRRVVRAGLVHVLHLAGRRDYAELAGRLGVSVDLDVLPVPEGVPLADWRRANINDFVATLYREVKARKSHVSVGISPFGIWRPGNPPGVNGLDAYATISQRR